MPLLKRVAASDVARARPDAVDEATLQAARSIVDDVAERGEQALREHAQRLDDWLPDTPLVFGPAELKAAFASLPRDQQELLERTAQRIRGFAEAQRACLSDLDVAIPGGRAGHRLVPLERAGCYAPGGRFPLPSSVLMTAIPARVAGVREVWVASPRPTAVTLGAAAVAGADALLAAGGAQAVAALALGAGVVPACAAVVGPGNRWVTAAKQLVSGRTKIEFLAGPSELLVLADDSADPARVAADLLAQAEHDVDAGPMLISLSAALLEAVEQQLELQLSGLPTANTARASLATGGFAVLAESLEQALGLCDVIASEHLALHLEDSEAAAQRLRHFGAVFIGENAAEVLADYGAGPNHVLPTGGTARHVGGLSVFDFLAVRTWMRVDDPQAAAVLAEDAAQLARLEGLEAHARAADLRRPGGPSP